MTVPPETVIDETEAAEAAAAFRRTHSLGDRALGDLVAIIERVTGIDVAILRDVDAGADGIAVHDPVRNVSMIAVAATSSPMRLRSTLAHELGHVVFADWTTMGALAACSPEAIRLEEVRARAFARHLLIPEAGLRASIAGRPADLATLSAVVQYFLVSPAIASMAFARIGAIEPRDRDDWSRIETPTLAMRFGWIDQYRTLQEESKRPRAPQRLFARAVNGYQQNVVSAQTIATLLGENSAQTIVTLEESGIVPEPIEPIWASATDLPDVTIDRGDFDDNTGPVPG